MLETVTNLGLGLLILWTFFLTGMLIWNNPLSHQEVQKAEEKENGPWPKT